MASWRFKDEVCADMFTTHTEYLAGSNIWRTEWADDVFPVPIVPVSSTGLPSYKRALIKYWYLNVSMVGTIIL